jgi:hypothetical protein
MPAKPKQKRAKYLPRGSGVRVGLGIRLRPELLQQLRAATGNMSRAIEEAVELWLAQHHPTPAPKTAAPKAATRKRKTPSANRPLGLETVGKSGRPISGTRISAAFRWAVRPAGRSFMGLPYSDKLAFGAFRRSRGARRGSGRCGARPGLPEHRPSEKFSPRRRRLHSCGRSPRRSAGRPARAADSTSSGHHHSVPVPASPAPR